MGFDNISTLDDSPDAIINITDDEQVNFCETGNLNNTLHQDNQNIGKVHQKFSKFNSNITSKSESYQSEIRIM